MATLLAALALAPAGARADSKCTAAKHQAAGAYAKALEACRAKGVKKGSATDPECLARALAKLERSFEKAERKGDCVATHEQALAAGAADVFASDLLATLERGAGVCCDLPAEACGWTTSPENCTTAGGTVGTLGSVCDASGACVLQDAVGGSCCQGPKEDLLPCTVKGDATPDDCTADLHVVSGAICVTSRCVRID